jgi:hypothetical protein
LSWRLDEKSRLQSHDFFHEELGLVLVSMEVAVAEGCAHIFALGSDKKASLDEDEQQESRARRTEEGPFLRGFNVWGVLCFEAAALQKKIEDIWLWNSGDFPHSNGIERVLDGHSVGEL